MPVYCEIYNNDGSGFNSNGNSLVTECAGSNAADEFSRWIQ